MSADMPKQKLIILLGDGMPDQPIQSLGGRTPLMVAFTPNMDKMAKEGSTGFVHTVPQGFEPGSDVTNMGLLGYDPKKFYTGRSPLEAAGMKIELGTGDVAYRCNFVTLAPSAEGVFMEDFSAGHITSEEGAELIDSLNNLFAEHDIDFYSGVSYRHLMVWRDGSDAVKTTPPHDIIGNNVKNYLPNGEAGERLRHIIGEAQIVMAKHPVNIKRKSENKPEANSIWLWGQGKKPSMPTLKDYRDRIGAMISAVDLMRGIAEIAEMDVIEVDGATGYIDTNYEGKANAAKKALKEKDVVYVHLEAPDESGHAGSLENKIKAIEDFDLKIVGPLLAEAGKLGARAIAISDHPTPVALMTHTTNPVPFAVFPPIDGVGGQDSFDESIIENSSFEFKEGYQLFEKLIS